jgi:parallel beta-helix repeat protein
LIGPGIGIRSNGKHNITIKNLVIVQHDSGSSSHGILIQNTENTRIINCTASSAGGAGIYVTGNNVTVDRCSTNSFSGRSLYLVVNNSSITNCTARTDSGHGISIMASNNNYVTKCAGYLNTSYGIYLSLCKYNTFIDSIGYTNSTKSGDGIYISFSSNNTFDQVNASPCLKTGFFLDNVTMYNNFINCTGESYGEDSLYNGIWFAFPRAECAGTNTYTNFVSHSKLVTSSTDLNLVKFPVIGDSIAAGGHSGLPYCAYTYYANLSLGNRHAFFNEGLANETVDKGRLRFIYEIAAYKPEYVSSCTVPMT